MKCSDLDELLSAYANDELARTQREFIEEHLSSCAECQATLADYAEVRQHLMSLKEVRAMPDLKESIMPKIRAAKHAPLEVIKRTSAGRFIPRRLSWRTGLIGILALAMVVSLVVTIPPLFRQDDKVLATSIALNSLEVRAALEDREIRELEVLDVVYSENSDIATVILQLEYNFLIAADVDMETEQVIETHLLALTDKKKQEIIDMAEADSRVQDLLEQGAYVYDFEMGYYPDALAWGINPSGVVLFPYLDSNAEVLTKFLFIIRMALENNEYWIVLDPILGNVFDVIDVAEAKQRMEEDGIILITITTPTPTESIGISITVTVNGLGKGEGATLRLSPRGEEGRMLMEQPIRGDDARGLTVQISPNLEDGNYLLLLEAPEKYFRDPKGYSFNVYKSKIGNPRGRPIVFNFNLGPPSGMAEAIISFSAPVKEAPPTLTPTPTSTPTQTPTPISSGHPKGMESLRWLTDAEKDRVIEIALNTPEALGLLETGTYYEASVRWVAINWVNDHAAALYGFDYEEADEGVPEGVPESYELYSQVEIYFGEPAHYLLSVAINPDTGEVAHVEEHGLKPIPVP